MLDVFRDIYNNSNIAQEFFSREPIMSIPNSTHVSMPTYFKNKRMVGLLQGDLPNKSGYKDSSSLKDEVNKLTEDLEVAKSGNEEGTENYKTLSLEIRELNKQKEELDKKLRELDGSTEKDILARVRRLTRSASGNSPRKFNLSELKNFRADYNELEEMVINRLTKRNTA